MEKEISEIGWQELEHQIEVAEANYMESVRMVAHYGADQDGWHGEAYGMHYAEQLKKMDELMRLKAIQRDFHIVHIKPKGKKVEIGCLVEIEIGTKKQKVIVDGFRYKSVIPVVTPESPIGTAILGKRVGDKFEVNGIKGFIKSIKL